MIGYRSVLDLHLKKLVQSQDRGIAHNNAGSILATGNILMPQILNPVAIITKPPTA